MVEQVGIVRNDPSSQSWGSLGLCHKKTSSVGILKVSKSALFECASGILSGEFRLYFVQSSHL